MCILRIDDALKMDSGRQLGESEEELSRAEGSLLSKRELGSLQRIQNVVLFIGLCSLLRNRVWVYSFIKLLEISIYQFAIGWAGSLSLFGLFSCAFRP
jgi:hypothetical protein